MPITKSALCTVAISVLFATSGAGATDLDYASVAGLSCKDFLEAYGTDLFFSLSPPIIGYVTERERNHRFGSAANIGDYVAIGCRLHENYRVGEAVNDLFEQEKGRGLPALPIGDATSDPRAQAQWDALDNWLHHKGPRPKFK